jgi:predicted Zn-dependent peptidase
VDLAEKWFGTLPAGNKYQRNLPMEPAQTEARRLTVKRDVPLDAIYLAFHCCARKDDQYYALEMLTDVLFSGHSSRFYVELVKKQQLFSELSGYCTGDFDKGLVVIEGKLVKGISPEQAEQAIMAELEKIKKELIQPDELTKVKNKIESSYRFTELSVLNKAMNLAFSELLGDANDVNKELDYYHAVTADQIAKQANEVFQNQNCSTLYYLAN